MKTKAILMTLAMMSATLAGWTGSNGTMEIDGIVHYSTKYVIPVE
tara:strand:- start:1350 stop:1484 length:135 start_codon:yes stop_codon:yes gene_type:complete